MTPTFSAMRLLQYAMQGIGSSLNKMQMEVIMHERFGNDAAPDKHNYNPLRSYSTLEEKRERVNQLTTFAKEVQVMLDKVQEKEMEESAQAFVSSLKSKKQ